MDWGHLLFKFDGRINRAKFWLVWLLFAATYIALWIVGIATESMTFQTFGSILILVMLFSILAAGIKRLHDRNKPGWYLVLFYVLPTLLLLVGIKIDAALSGPAWSSTVTALLAFAIIVWGFVEMGCLRGTIGVNQYGPDPVAPATIPPVRLPT